MRHPWGTARQHPGPRRAQSRERSRRGPDTKHEGRRQGRGSTAAAPAGSGPGPGAALRHGEGRRTRPGQPRRRSAGSKGPSSLAAPLAASLPLRRARDSGTQETPTLPAPRRAGPAGRAALTRGPAPRPRARLIPAAAPPPAGPPSQQPPSPSPPSVRLRRDRARRWRATATSSRSGAQNCPSHNGLPVLNTGRARPAPLTDTRPAQS